MHRIEKGRVEFNLSTTDAVDVVFVGDAQLAQELGASHTEIAAAILLGVEFDALLAECQEIRSHICIFGRCESAVKIEKYKFDVHILSVLIEGLHTRLRNTHNALILIRGKFHKEIVNRVYAHTVIAYLVVEVWRE